MPLCVCAHAHVCMCCCSNITAGVTAATSQWLPCDWRPDILPRSPHKLPCPSRLALSITSPSSHSFFFSSLHFLIHPSLSLQHLSFYFAHLFFLCLFFNLSPPHLVCGSSLSSVMLFAPTVLPVSVSMETPSGQEWLWGLWDADTEPISSHTLFLSQWATCFQPGACKPIVCVNRWWRMTGPLPAITQVLPPPDEKRHPYLLLCLWIIIVVNWEQAIWE